MIPSATWTEGYVTDVTYIINFYHHQVPDFLNFCCLLYGFIPLDLNKKFTYCELGCGNGFTANIIASLYPHAEVYAIDFMPEHIEFANYIKESANLKNITFMEVSFKELVESKIDQVPDFDIITLHGVFSWVSHENRMEIVKFASKKLKPGGILSVSYNNMCGWYTRVPLQKFIIDFAKLFPEIVSIGKMKIIMNFIKKLQEAGSIYFNNPLIKKTLKKTDEQDINYLVHEYLNEDWQPLFFSDVVSYMQKAKLKYVGIADPIWKFENLLFEKKQLEAINSFRSFFMKEIVKDYILSVAFRKDIYIKGGQFLNPQLYKDKIENVKLVLRDTVEDKPYKIELKYSPRNVNVNPRIIDAILNKITEKNTTIKELMYIPELKDEDFSFILAVVAMLIHKRIINPVTIDRSDNIETARSLNRFIASRSRYYNDLKHFVLPEAFSAMPATAFHRLTYDAIVNGNKKDLDDILQHVKKYVDVLGINWEAFGENKSKDEVILKEVGKCIDKFLPLWEKTKAI